MRGTLAMVPAFVLTMVVEVVVIVTTEISQAELWATSILLFWALYGVSAMVLTWHAFGRVPAEELERRILATAPPEGRARRALWAWFGGGAVSWALTGSTIAVIAVVYLALNPAIASSPFVSWSAVAAIASAWAVTSTAYAVRFARENVERGGADFPGEGRPAFTEYVYLAVQLGTTFSSSDVTITSSSMRRVVIGNSVISFAFNTVIVALFVSVLISRVG
jgi:uncharacterized membrane protein